MASTVSGLVAQQSACIRSCAPVGMGGTRIAASTAATHAAGPEVMLVKAIAQREVSAPYQARALLVVGPTVAHRELVAYVAAAALAM